MLLTPFRVLCSYKHAENQFVVFADDVLPRWVTCSALLDYDTIVAGDKFGNIFAVSVAQSSSKPDLLYSPLDLNTLCTL